MRRKGGRDGGEGRVEEMEEKEGWKRWMRRKGGRDGGEGRVEEMDEKEGWKRWRRKKDEDGGKIINENGRRKKNKVVALKEKKIQEGKGLDLSLKKYFS